MYLKTVRIENVRSIKSLHWKIPGSKFAGWHVVIGDNGSGKSTLLRSIALACIGPTDAMALRQNWHEWLRTDAKTGKIAINFCIDHDFDKFSGSGKVPKNKHPLLSIWLSKDKDSKHVRLAHKRTRFDPDRHLWGGKAGWFIASYGPFRRFAGGDKNIEKLYYSVPRLARHLSVFGEGAALSECLVWLQSLKFKALEAEKKGGGQHNHAIQLLDYVEDFINESELLPHSTRIKQVTSSAVEFVDGNGFPMPVEDLSDGYRSILSMTFELIRQLVATYGVKKVFADSNPTRISVPGVVLVDEIDAHLHPTWQRRIGLWFREHFPQIQFVVTTHSPLICQAAVVGSVFRLPKPGTDQQGEMIEGTALDRLLYGNVLDAYGTEEFGPDVGRSEVGKKFLARLALLNQKELDGTLRQRERVERNHLRAMLPTNAHILAQNER